MTNEREEINPSRQRGVSTDVLAERFSNFADQNRSEFSALHHHLASIEGKVDTFMDAFNRRVATVEQALHDHTLQQHHAGTESQLIHMADQHLQFERKFSEIDKTFAQMERDRLIEKAAIEARTKQRNQGLTALDKAIGIALLCVPIAITLIRG